MRERFLRRASPSGSGLIPTAYFPRLRRCVSTTCGASAACRRTSIRSIHARRSAWNASGLREVFDAGSGQVVGHVLPRGARLPTGALASGAVVSAREHLLPDSRRFAHWLPAAARLAAVDRSRDYPDLFRPTRSSRFRPLPTPGAQVRFELQRSRRPRMTNREQPARIAARTERAPASLRVRGLDHRALRCAPSRATACSIFSCRRPNRSKIISSSSRRSKPAAEALQSCRCVSKVTSRRAIRGWSIFAVTPDPGVIEVNIHPASTGTSWSSTRLSSTKRRASVAARDREIHARRPPHRHRRRQPLRARRRDAGGLAVPAPARSARSLLAYWHNHPSLSYLFSRPVHRPDQPGAAHRRSAQRFRLRTRNRVPRNAAPRSRDGFAPPWLVDRLLRNLLIDVTGNTHRAEFCIDKLYSPDGPTGRLGLLEMRAFEMPPHARMSLTQQLLMRALFARFWKTPMSRRI